MNKQDLINEIKSTFTSLRSILSKFSEEELNTAPFNGSWTAGQVAEHIIKSIGGIPDSQTQATDRAYDEKIEPVRAMFLNMEMKFKTDPFLEPEKTHHEVDYLLDTLSEWEKRHTDTVREVDLEALCLDMELPTFGYLTRYEWMRFMMVHAQRHTRQIENIHDKLNKR
jgi:hypothetical protein